MIKMGDGVTRRNFIFSFSSLFFSVLFHLGCKKWKETEISRCLQPKTHTQKTIEAFLDTIIPGEMNDPERKPGAEEGCVINVFYDPSFFQWFSSPLELLAKDLDAFSIKAYDRKFIELNFEERTHLLIERENYFYYPAIAFALVAFYSGWYNPAGLKLMGFVPNAGVSDTSYGKKFAEEMTLDGNLP